MQLCLSTVALKRPLRCLSGGFWKNSEGPPKSPLETLSPSLETLETLSPSLELLQTSYHIVSLLLTLLTDTAAQATS